MKACCWQLATITKASPDQPVSPCVPGAGGIRPLWPAVGGRLYYGDQRGCAGGLSRGRHALSAALPICVHRRVPPMDLLFGVVVLGLGQVQRLGSHPKLGTVVVPVLTMCAVGLTITQLLLLRAAAAKDPTPPQEEEGLVYLSDYAMALISMISANYFGQHTFLETMAGMEHPATFQHSTATAQVATLLMNAAIGLASLSIPTLKVKGFIAFAFTSSDFLPR